MTSFTSLLRLEGQVRASTSVSFPSGATQGLSCVQAVLSSDQTSKIGIILENTPFHPVDPKWSDQPADRGHLSLEETGSQIIVDDCQVMAVNKETQEVKSPNAVEKNEKDSWHSVVVHYVSGEGLDPSSLLGRELFSKVDALFRKQLSLHHTASHLAALALNEATQEMWKKPQAARKDSFAMPDLDKEAIDSSAIFPDHTKERYRFGSSLRKKFNVNELFRQLSEVESRINQRISEWISESAKVAVIADDPKWEAMRKWSCHLPHGIAEIPCGGTHVSDLAEFALITYKLEIEQGNEQRMCATIVAEAKT